MILWLNSDKAIYDKNAKIASSEKKDGDLVQVRLQQSKFTQIMRSFSPSSSRKTKWTQIHSIISFIFNAWTDASDVLLTNIRQKFQHTILHFPTSKTALFCLKYYLPITSKPSCQKRKKICTFLKFCRVCMFIRLTQLAKNW